MTEFRVEVVRIGEIQKHSNADSLSIAMVHGGYPVIFKTGDFATGDTAVYIPVDALVPVSSDCFSFLAKEANADGYARIKAKRLRGVFSMGLLIKNTQGLSEGDDAQEALGIRKWLPPSEREDAPVTKKQSAKRSGFVSWVSEIWKSVKKTLGLLPSEPPHVPVYDLDGLRKFSHVLKQGESVVITEKIHGCNARYIHDGKRLHVGSRTKFREDHGNVWRVIADRLDLERKLSAFPWYVLLGEVYGSVQDLNYGVPQSEGVRFAAFDVIKPSSKGDRCEFLSSDEFEYFCASIGVPTVPTLYRGKWDNELKSLAEGKSVVPGANHIREGFVVKPTTERYDSNFGRVILKMPGEGYLTRKEK